MNDVELVVIRSFSSRPEADLAKSALEAAGIESLIRADSAGEQRPAMAWGAEGFQVIVRSDDAEAAREILNV